MRWIKLGVVFTAAALLMAGCNGGQDGSARTVKIGAVLSLTGQFSEYGESIKNGMEIAIDKINREQGGVKGSEFSVTFRDGASDIETAMTELEALVEEGYEIIVGAETTELTKDLIPLAAEKKIVLISPSASSPDLKKGIEKKDLRYFFRICPSDDKEALLIAGDLPELPKEGLVFIKKPFARALVLIRKDDPYTEGLWKHLAKSLHEKEVQYRQPPIYFDHKLLQSGPAQDTNQFNDQMKEILAEAGNYQHTERDNAKRGAIIILGFSADVEKLLKAFHKEGLDVQAYASHAAASAKFVEDIGELGDGLIFSSIYQPKHSHYQPFRTAYREKFGKEPDLYATYGYDVAMLLAKTFETAENIESLMENPLNLRLAMNNVEWYGLTGHVDFAKGDNEVAKEFRLFTLIKDKETGMLIQKDARDHRDNLYREIKRRQAEEAKKR